MRMSLAHLTVLDASPLELIDAAKQGGFDSAGLRIVPPMATDKIVEVIGNELLVRAILQRMSDTGVDIWDIEALWLTPTSNVSSFSPALEVGQRLGAKHLLVVGHDPDFNRIVDNFSRLCEECAKFQLGAALEMMSYVELRTLAQAKRLLDAAGQDNASLLIDALHFFRSGANPSELADINPSYFKYVHLCDAPLDAPPTDALRLEGRGGRSYPGEGKLPLIDLLNALPPDIGIAVEAPNAQLANLSVFDRAARCGDATRRLLAEAQRR